MSGAPMPPNEDARLAELESLDILDSLPEEAYDAITLLASQICDVPIALISLLDRDRQWFKSRIGVDVEETPRDLAFCGHAILAPDEMMVVRDAAEDYRFAENPLVAGHPSIRFYAGVPLVTEAGNALGTLCVIDREPRILTDEQKSALEALSTQVMALLELRQSVDELRAHQSQLESTMRQKENLIATVSHEIRTPLTAIIGLIETLIDPTTELSAAERKELLQTAGREATDVSGLIEDLLTAAKAESGTLSVKCVNVNLCAQTAQVLEGLDPDYVRGVSLVLEEEPCRALGDPARIRQVIRNLLTNAFRYGGPDVQVRISYAGDRCRLQVEDDGEGIPLDDRERIFESYQQVESGLVTESIGLGLPVSRLLSEKMGGTLTYEQVDGRSVFCFELPAAAAAGEVAA